MQYLDGPPPQMTCENCGFGFTKPGYSQARVHPGNNGSPCANCEPHRFPHSYQWDGGMEIVVQSTIQRELA